MRFLFALTLSIIVAAGVALQPAGAWASEASASALLAPPASEVAQAATPVQTPEVDLIRQAYDLLMDQYVQPLEPTPFLSEAYELLITRLRDSGVDVAGAPADPIEGDRDGAFAAYIDRLTGLGKTVAIPETPRLTELALSALADSLEENHTAYLTQQRYRDFLAYLRGDQRYGGIGLRPTRPGVTIAEVFPDSPAAAAGLMPGDMILKVDGDSVEGKTLEQVAQLIRGTEGTVVVLEIVRPRTGEQFVREITRASIPIIYVSKEMLDQRIGYLRLRAFAGEKVAEEFEKLLDELATAQPRGLVIDLRGNSGGRVDIGLRLLNRFIASGPVFKQVGRAGRERVESATGSSWLEGAPIAVLIDDGTASMGEIFAQAMRERGVARLFGQKTSGNVAAAQIYPLSDGSAMQVTVSEILSGDGRRMNRRAGQPDEEVGVEPDVPVERTPDDLEAGRDPQLEAAVAYLKHEATARAASPSR